MNESKRKFLKALPAAALVPTILMNIDGTEVKAIETIPGKRYIFMIPGRIRFEQVQHIQKTLVAKGFADCLVVSGDVQIYELEK